MSSETSTLASSGSMAALGFGCSSLTSVGRKKALTLLGTAFESNIRHFDVARYYGYGEAEGILGTFLKSCRAEVTVTTKFGIEPPRRTSGLRIFLAAGRRFLRFVPSARRMVQRHTSSLLTGITTFGVKDAQRNLETSLQQLGTDYIDFYLLHDYVPTDRSSDDLVDFLQRAVQAGKIRHFGLGTSIDSVMQALNREPELCDVIQFQNSVLTRNRDKLPAATLNRMVITHGALGGLVRSLSSFLSSEADRTIEWSKKLDLDCSDEKVLASLLLNYAVFANPGGLVLFSARTTDRVRTNAESVLNRRVTQLQATLFGQLVNDNLHC